MLEVKSFEKELTESYALSDVQIEQFQNQGYIKLKNVLSAELLAFYEKEITTAVMDLYVASAPAQPHSDGETYAKAFRQIMNLWRHSDVVKRFVFSKRLAGLAAALMGVKGVRLYHDQALYKLEDGGITPWHADQYYWPLSSANTCTVWVPLQAVPVEMAPLSFSAGSHKVELHRELPISDESEEKIRKTMEETDLPYEQSSFDLGEVSFHYGWTMHNTAANNSGVARKVMTVIYMEDGIKLIESQNENHMADWKNWMPGAVVGEAVNTALNPILF